ncbi:MAG TPA: hypothetical protein VMW63_07950 [Methanoregulaceae archaeon]|nr:hypothetical protein [Methanoregulaceae archaeon]
MNRRYILISVIVIGLFALCAGCTETPLEKPSITPVGTPIPVETGTPVMMGHQGSNNMSLQTDLDTGVYLVRMENNGTALFLVEIENEQYYQQIIRSDGNVRATQAIGIPVAGAYLMNVTSDGPWDITIARPETNDPVAPPLTLDGSGYSASGNITLPAGNTSFTMENFGTGPFAVFLYNETGGLVFDPTGTYVQPLHYHIGSYKGTVIVAIPDDGRYVLSIISDGAWRIKIV